MMPAKDGWDLVTCFYLDINDKVSVTIDLCALSFHQVEIAVVLGSEAKLSATYMGGYRMVRKDAALSN